MLALPTPPSILQAKSKQLLEVIQQQILLKQGAISFAEYMDLALYTPGLGYYSNGLIKFGAEGDFITAPELSSLFGYCMAKQCAEILAQTGGQLLEFGAGTGKLAVDILSQLAAWECLPEAYLIVEPSAELQQRQRQLFKEQAPHLLSSVLWLTELPTDFTGVVLANEVLDAMPVHLFEVIEQTLYERWVGWHDGQLAWQRQLVNADTILAKQVGALQKQYGSAWQHYISEISLLIPAWLSSIEQMLKQGVVLLIDYGFPSQEYYHPERNMGTLMCHYRHYAHADPFYYPGLQDITAHVDFSQVAESAFAAGLQVLGYTQQAAFLLNCGLLEGLEKQATDELTQFQLAQQVKKLTLAHEMGELFKVMALGKNVSIDLLGFKWQDQSHRL